MIRYQINSSSFECKIEFHMIKMKHDFQLNDYELRKGKRIGVTISFNNHRLFVGNIPKNKDREELLEELRKHARKQFERLNVTNLNVMYNKYLNRNLPKWLGIVMCACTFVNGRTNAWLNILISRRFLIFTICFKFDILVF